MENKQYNDAAKELDLAIRNNEIENYPIIYFTRAEIYEIKKEYSKALKNINKAIELIHSKLVDYEEGSKYYYDDLIELKKDAEKYKIKLINKS
ncbi:MAG: hypothetical protein GY756_21115 [bacterium]|nr:hypothetical protein [bacterium]